MNKFRQIPHFDLTTTQIESLNAEYDRLHDRYESIGDSLDMVAEEATELAKAALKLKRSLGYGPTCNVDAETALDDFSEEYGDVLVTVAEIMRRLPASRSADHNSFTKHCMQLKRQRYIEGMGGTLPDGVQPLFGEHVPPRCLLTTEDCPTCQFAHLCKIHSHG